MDDLINQLERINRGANAHIINKTLWFLKYHNNRKYDDKLWQGYYKRRIKKITKAVYGSLQTGDWKEVKKLMHD